MSVIVKGMKLPRPGDMMVCALIDGKLQCSIVTRGKSIEWCEVLEIPTPHGRLIDADAVIARLKHLYCDVCGCDCSTCQFGAFIKYIEGRPTIIEAEVSE